VQHEAHQARDTGTGHRGHHGRHVVAGMSRQPWRDCPPGSKAYEAHEDKLRGQTDLFELDDHRGTMDGPPEVQTPELLARLVLLDAELVKASQRMKAMLTEARPHVYRQQHHGRHEQDRADAVAWMDKWVKPLGGE